MASKIKVDQIEGSTGSSITIPTGQTLTVTDGLSASTIASGTLADARIPNLNASKINAGTLADARLPSTALNSNVDLTTLSASNLTSGTLPDARLPTVPVAKGGTGITSLGSAGQVVQVNSGGSALEFATASSGKTLVAPTRIAHDNTEVSASQSGTNLANGTFFFPSNAKLSGSFTKTSATSVLCIAYTYTMKNNGTNQHDTYCWAGTGLTKGTAGNNFRYHLGDDSSRSFGENQYSKGTIFITGMSAGSHTINVAAGTTPDRTHTYFYSHNQTSGDRANETTPSTLWAWEQEV